jgi:hypothetical protein
MKILVERKDIDNARIAIAQIRHGIISSEYTASQVLDFTIQAEDCLLKTLRDNPEPVTKELTPQETVEFLIEITDTLAAYLWNKKEEVTTHKYANYLDELRGKLEEYE